MSWFEYFWLKFIRCTGETLIRKRVGKNTHSFLAAEVVCPSFSRDSLTCKTYLALQNTPNSPH
ncbi:hypothetical protein [Rubritalea tangerina]|uniref:hypothetical protein n=1 Tax=Rubritalea tangerina TaxID=430798 RepID=UPI0036127613